jgi:hypothetical protein
MRLNHRVRLFVAAFLIAPSGWLLAQSPVDPTGHWEGAINAPGTTVAIEIDLVRTGTGSLEGTFGQPAERVRGLPLTNFAQSGRSIEFQVKGGAPGQRVFKGDVSENGQTIAGAFASQFGTLPFSITRAGEARVERPAASAAIGKELEGVWEGTLNVDGGLTLILRLANQGDGTSIGTIVNQQQAVEIPISAIVQRSSDVTLDLKAVEGFFSGSLNASATELVGTFSQRSLSMPLTFRRTK